MKGKRISNWVVMGKVAEADVGNANAKLVLIRMAFSINTERAARGDFVVWPSVDRVVRDTHLSPRTVQRALRRLEKSGLIAVESSAHQWHTTRWRIEVTAIDALRFPAYRVSARRPNVGGGWTMKDERQWQQKHEAAT